MPALEWLKHDALLLPVHLRGSILKTEPNEVVTQKRAFLFEVHCASPGIQVFICIAVLLFPNQKLSCNLIFSTESGHHC